MVPAKTSPVPHSMQKRAFYILMCGRLISGAGSYFNLIAINLFILIKTGSPVIMGLAMAARIITACIASPVMGSLADKMDRKTGMIISDAVLAAAMLVLASVSNTSAVIPAVFIVQILLGIFQNFFMINMQSALPHVAPEGNLILANTWFQIVTCSTIIIGGIGAASAIDIVGYRAAFVIDAATYLASLIILSALKIKTRDEKRSHAVESGFMNGLKFIRITAPFIFLIFIVRMLDGVGSGSHNIALPIFSERLDPLNPGFYYGALLAFWGAGNLASAAYLNFSKRGKEIPLKSIFIISTYLMSVSWIAIFQTSIPSVFLAFALVAGIFDCSATVSYNVMLQRTDDAVRGRVMGLSTIAMMGGFGGGIALASLMSSFMSPARLVAFWHGIPIVIITIMFIYWGLIRTCPREKQSTQPQLYK